MNILHGSKLNLVTVAPWVMWSRDKHLSVEDAHEFADKDNMKKSCASNV